MQPRGHRAIRGRATLVAAALTLGPACQDDGAFTEVAPILSVTPDALEFGEVPQGATRRLSLTIANTGNAALTLAAPEIDAPFAIALSGTPLPPGARETVDVWFRPDVVGPAAGSLRVLGDGGEATVALTGAGVAAVLTVRPSEIAWRDQPASTADEVALTAFAAGAEVVEARVVAAGFSRPEHFSSPFLPDFAAAAALAIEPGGRQVGAVTYGPFAAGRDDGRLVFEVCGDRCGVEVEITANAVEPALLVEPPVLAFGEVGIGFSDTLAASVRNGGDVPRTLGRLALEGDGGFTARVVGGLPRTLGPGEQAAVEVTFAPTGPGPAATDVAVALDDASARPVRLAASGTGVGPRFEVTPNPLSFGIERGPGTYRRPVILVNAGSGEIEVRGLTLTGDPQIGLALAPGLPLRLGPGQSEQLDVRFSPTEVGEYAATLEVEGDAPVTVPITAGMAESVCRLEPNTSLLRFGVVVPGQSRARAVTLENVGVDTCEVLRGAFRAPDDGTFTATVAWPRTLGPGETMQVGFQYTPTQAVVSKGTYVMTTADPVFPERTVSLQGLATNLGECLEVVPDFLDFGGLRAGETRRRAVRVRNIGNQTCTVQGSRLDPSGDPAFTLPAAAPRALAPGEETRLSVDFSPTSFGRAEGRLLIDTDDPATSRFEVALTGISAVSNLCVQPRRLDFGLRAMPAELTFELIGCGPQPVRVTDLSWTQADPELTLVQPRPTPYTLRPGDVETVRVRYATADQQQDRGVITVRSDDPLEPAIDVEVTGGPELVPPAAGRFLYYWQIGDGDLLRLPLQGLAVPQPVWGPATGKRCAGCHSLSPDGRYLAFTDATGLVVVDLTTNQEVPLALPQGAGHYPSWEPPAQPGGTPSYRFVYSVLGDLHVASVANGDLGPVAGAAEQGFLETMPTWSSDGRIAFVRAPGPLRSSLQFFGRSDLMLTTPAGGAPAPVAGASQTTSANYYPAFSPNARWIAYTKSDFASGTVSAIDARVQLVAADGSGTVLRLDTANGVGGANSYPTWSLDGTFLSFSSNRTGGAGRWDLYIVPIDPITGRDQPAQNVTEVNTAEFEHAGFWSR